MSNDINKVNIERKIESEYKFFDQNYWRSRASAVLNTYLMGHGLEDYG